MQPTPATPRWAQRGVPWRGVARRGAAWTAKDLYRVRLQVCGVRLVQHGHTKRLFPTDVIL